MLVKALCLGDSGNGKSGALASLASAGYNLYVLDYDNKMNNANTLQSALEEDAAAWSRVRWRSFRDKIKFVNGKPALATPVTAYKALGATLTEWAVDSFTNNDVLVLDTLTTLSEAAWHEACAMAGKLGMDPRGSDHPGPQQYGWMADSLKLAMEMLTDLPCHVIVNAHVKITATEEELLTIDRNSMGLPTEAFTKAIGLPNARGKEIPKDVNGYFSNTLYFTRQGPNRVITTRPTGIVDVKTSKIKGIKPFYKIEDGLAELFVDLGAVPPTKCSQQQPTEATTHA